MEAPIYHLEGVVKAKEENMEDFVGPLDLILHLLSKNKMEIKDIQIKPEVIDPDDAEMLQDLIMVATNEALRQMEEISQNEMSKLTAGLGIPGL